MYMCRIKNSRSYHFVQLWLSLHVNLSVSCAEQHPVHIDNLMSSDYRKNLCISRTFLLKYWAQRRGCGSYTRAFVHGVVKLWIRDNFLSK